MTSSLSPTDNRQQGLLHDERKKSAAANVASFSEWKLIQKEVSLLLHNRDYCILFVVFSIGVGFFNAILTLLNQIIDPFGYSNDDAGTFGAVFILFGLIGAGIVGKVMEKTKAYKTILRVGIVAACVATCFLLLMLYSNNFWPLALSWALLGCCVLPLLPVMMENCAECTYPVPEEVSMGILFAGKNEIALL
jgi:FLVCR family MFS transporter 7